MAFRTTGSKRGQYGCSMTTVGKKKPERKDNQLTRFMLKARYGMTDSMIRELKPHGKYYREADVVKWLKKYKATQTEEEWQAMMQRAADFSRNTAEGQYNSKRIPTHQTRVKKML